MEIFYRILNGILIIATLQFFAPLFNATISERCCESQQMQCCQGEFPARAVCCIEKPDVPLNDSAPIQGVKVKIAKILSAGIACLQINTFNFSIPFFENLETCPAFKYTIADNQLYKQLSTFLI